MASRDDYVELVRRAQLGDEECLNHLAEFASERLRMYVYRATLAHEKTEDIVQESMLEMFKVLGKLREADRFWPWLYKIAANKIHRHARTDKRQCGLSAARAAYAKEPKEKQGALENLVSQELREIVSSAMRGLKTQHRQILAMRCYDEMSYSDIAEVMGCSEFAARKLFCRAKGSLEKQLARRGLGKGMLLTALVVFGKLTAGSEAAAANLSVAAATVKVGVATGLAVVATSKTAIVSVATVGALAAGTMIAATRPQKAAALPKQEPASILQTTGSANQTTNIGDEYWYFFPEGTDGPVITRFRKADSRGQNYYCQWVQDEQANYHFDQRRNAVYINNYRQWRDDLSVWRLPTDQAGLREFLSRVEPDTEQTEHVSADSDNLMVVVRRNENGYPSWTTHHQNVLYEEYFRYRWPAGAKLIDNRDPMHKRGWTYFRVTGEINGAQVTGAGTIPFVYAASRQHQPWMRLRVGENEIVDDCFVGFTRPWMGLHTIDTVRRDAAQEQIWFETQYDSAGGKAEVKFTGEQGRMIYTIDMNGDVIEKIRLSATDGREGELVFEYLQEVSGVADEFVKPRSSRAYGQARRRKPGMFWLMRLAEPDLTNK